MNNKCDMITHDVSGFLKNNNKKQLKKSHRVGSFSFFFFFKKKLKKGKKSDRTDRDELLNKCDMITHDVSGFLKNTKKKKKKKVAQSWFL
jgi:hypothetical protein